MSTEIDTTKEMGMAELAMNTEITDEASMNNAADLLTSINQEGDRLKDTKDEVMRPLLDAVNAERKRWKPVEDKIKEAVTYLKKQMTIYQTAQVKKAEEDKKNIVEDVKTGEIGMAEAGEKMNAVAVPEKKVAAAGGSVTFKTDYEVEVVDIHIIPAEYLEVKIPAIKAAHKNGVAVDGVKIVEIQVPVNRRK